MRFFVFLWQIPNINKNINPKTTDEKDDKLDARSHPRNLRRKRVQQLL